MSATASERPPGLLAQFFSIKLNWLLVLIPVSVVLEKTAAVPATILFFVTGMAIVPIAALIVRSTEQLAAHTGDAIGGLLNATFGNLPELIIAAMNSAEEVG